MRYAAVGTAASLAVAPLAPGTLQTLGFALVGMAAAVAVLTGARRHGVAGRVGWSLVALALAGWVAGDVTYLMRGHAPGPSFSLLPADVLYGSAYGVLMAGLLCFAHRQRLTGRRGSMVDAALVTVSVAVAVWVLLVEPDLREHGLSVESVLQAAYPMADVLLLGLVLWAARPARREGSARWALLGGLGLVLASAVVAGSQALGPQGGRAEPVLLAGWLIGYTIVGAAALHPSMTSLTEQDLRPEGLPGAPQLVRIAVAVATAPALMAVQLALGWPVSATVVLVAAPVTLALALVRLSLLLRRLDEQTRLLGGAAETDVVTGLPNRRALLRTLTGWFAQRENDEVRALVCVLVLRQADLAEKVGLEANDALWTALAARAGHLAGPEALVARPAEGVLSVLVGVPPHGLDGLVAELREGLCRPLPVAGLEVRLDVGLGVLLLPQDARDAETAVHLAEAAAHAAVAARHHLDDVVRRVAAIQGGAEVAGVAQAAYHGHPHLAAAHRHCRLAYASPVAGSRYTR